MNAPEAIEYLQSLGMFGLRFGLDNVRRLAQLAGDPQNQLRFIHVAGTNGKGSTCAFLESIYRHAGLKVGLYTSPHLIHFSERIQINRTPIPHQDLAQLITQLQPLVESFPHEAHPTFFEVTTVLAWLYFAQHHCDLVILETGMGGRLDATNIVTPIASVITPIGFDHTEWLGHTLPLITREKAGIIKPHIPVITSIDSPECLEVVHQRARETHSPVVHSHNSPWPPQGWNPDQLSLQGTHQTSNARLACAVVDTLQTLIPVPQQAILDGLSHTHWPGRFQRVNHPSGTLILDGAHNSHGAHALRQTFQKLYPQSHCTLILGVLADKAWTDLILELAPITNHIHLVPVQTPRSASPSQVQQTLLQLLPHIPTTTHTSLSSALQSLPTFPTPTHPHPTLITGSLYLIGEALELLSPTSISTSTSSLPHERHLNHWKPQPHPPTTS